MVEFCAPDVKTERGKQDVFYRQHALGLLLGDDRFAWLCDEKLMDAGAPNAWKPTILTELGRFDFAGGDILEAASEICRVKPKTKAAIAMIRGWRLGRREGTVDGLAHALCEAFNGYLDQHPGTTKEAVQEALQVFRFAVQAANEDPDPEGTA